MNADSKWCAVYMPLSEFKKLVRDQFAMLLIGEKAALASFPSLLPADAATRSASFNAIREIVVA